MSEKIEKIPVYRSVESIISKYEGTPGALLSILKEIQEQTKYNYLDRDILKFISEKLKVPLSKVYSFITFYTFFNLEPQGENSIIVCRGTACHTRGSKKILDYLKKRFELENISKEKQSFTTKDNKFTVKSVACFGQCALAPVVCINGVIYSQVTIETLDKIISKIYRSYKSKTHENI